MFAFNNSISQNTAQPHAFLLEGKLQEFYAFLFSPPWISQIENVALILISFLAEKRLPFNFSALLTLSPVVLCNHSQLEQPRLRSISLSSSSEQRKRNTELKRKVIAKFGWGA